MGLFDAIRYPITDIFDPEQISCLPREILDEWTAIITHRTRFESWKHNTEFTNHSLLAFSCVLERCPKIGVDENDETFDMFAKYYTSVLKQLIIDYEPKSES